MKAPGTLGGELSGARNFGVDENGIAGDYSTDCVTDPAMARYGTPVGNRLYVFYRKFNTSCVQQSSQGNTLGYKFTANIEAACSTPVTTNDELGGSCGTFSSESVVPGAVTSLAPTAAEFYDFQSGSWKLMLVYAVGTSEKQLRYRVLTVNAAGKEQWGAEQVIEKSAAVVSSPTATLSDTLRRVDVFAAGGSSVLKRWSYSTLSSTWDILDQDQTIAGSSSTIPAGSLGVGMTLGYLQGDLTTRMFAAVQRTGAPIDIYRRSLRSPNTWRAMGTVNIIADTKPAVAYVRENNSDVTFGRFYVAAAGKPTLIACKGIGGSYCAEMAFSQGNCDSGCPDRKLRTWTSVLQLVEEDRVAPGSSFALLYDPSHDTNLRGALSTGQIWFQPVADGILDTTIRKDQHDYEILAKNAACVFGIGACMECISQNPNGTCAQWR